MFSNATQSNNNLYAHYERRVINPNFTDSDLLNLALQEFQNDLVANLMHEITVDKATEDKLRASVARISNHAIDHFYFSLIKTPTAVFSRLIPSKALITSGKLAPLYSDSFDVPVFSDYGATNPDQTALHYHDLTAGSKPYTEKNATIFLSVNCTMDEKHQLTGKTLNSVLNYYLGKNKWNTVIFLEETGEPEFNKEKKDIWLVSNKKMLAGLLKKHKTGLTILDKSELIKQQDYIEAAFCFLNKMANVEVSAAIIDDVKRLIQGSYTHKVTPFPPSSSSIVMTKLLTQPKKKKNVSFAFAIEKDKSPTKQSKAVAYPTKKDSEVTSAIQSFPFSILDSFYRGLMQEFDNPATTNEEKERLKLFWAYFCTCTDASLINSFCLFTASNNVAHYQEASSPHSPSLTKIKVSS
jgi:hypothetical protein